MFLAYGRLPVPVLLFLLLLASSFLFILSSFLFATAAAALLVAVAAVAAVGRCFLLSPPLLGCPAQNRISKSSTSANILYQRLETLAFNSSSLLF